MDNGVECALGELADERKSERAVDMLHSVVSSQLEPD